MSLNKILSIILYVLMGFSAILVAVFYLGGTTTGTYGEEPNITNAILIWSYGLVIAGAIFAVVFPVITMFSQPKNAIKTLIGVGGVGLIVLVAYLLASPEPMKTEVGTVYDNVKELKWVGTGIITSYILIAGAIVSIIYSSVAKIFK